MAVLAEPTPGAFRHPVQLYLAATRPPFLLVTFAGCLLGLASARHDGVPWATASALATLLLALCAHAAVNVLNDYFDARSGADAGNSQRVYPFTGGSRFIQNGVISESQALRYGLALLGVAAAGGLWLAFTGPLLLLWIGMAGLGVGWCYSAPPVALASRGLGELAIVACWWLVVAGTDLVQRGSLASLPWVAGFPYALAVANILYINQFPDADSDARAGKRTLVVRLGPARARVVYGLIVLLGLASLLAAIATGRLGVRAAWALPGFIPAVAAFQVLWRQAERPAALAPALRLTIVAALLQGLLLSIALAWR